MKDSLTHATAPVLKAGHLVSYLFCTSVLFVSCMYLDGGMGGGGWLLTSFVSFLLSIIILGLVCYKHTIHAKMFSIQMLTRFSQIVRRVCTSVLFIATVPMMVYYA